MEEVQGKDRKLTSSSMVDLKAELFRKQEEFKRQREGNTAFIRPRKLEKDKKSSIWSKQNAGVLARSQRDLETSEKDAEEEEMLSKSRKILEQKSKVYDSFTSSSSIPEEDGSEYYLVDFQKKAIDALVEEREVKRKAEEQQEEEEAERKALAKEIPEASCPDDEWVDFVDSLGRDRRCMRKDLNQLIKKDQELALAQATKKKSTVKSADWKSPESSKHDNQSSSWISQPSSQDRHRELMRQKWENEAQDMRNRQQDEVHYANVQFDEIRAHGVGFYQFSKDHAKREEELERLKQLREETKDQQSLKSRIKDKRKAMMEARLAKVRQRRKLKEEVAEEGAGKEDADSIGPKISEAVSSTKAEEDFEKEKEDKASEEARKNHIREWDKEKLKSTAWGAKNYVSTRRKERESEFAPPAMYFDQQTDTSKSSNRGSVSNLDRLRRLQESVPLSSGVHTTEHQSSSNRSNLDQTAEINTSAPLCDDGKQRSSGSDLIDSIPLPREAAAESGAPAHGNETKVPQTPVLPGFGSMEQASLPSATSRQDMYNCNEYPTCPQQYAAEQANLIQNWSYMHSAVQPQQQFQSVQGAHWTERWNPAPSNAQHLHHTVEQSTQPPQHWNPLQTPHHLNHPASRSSNHDLPSTNASFSEVTSHQNSASATTSYIPSTQRSKNIPESDKTLAPKKAKVPKLSIVDCRYVNNFDTSSINPELGSVPDVGGVPYKPGTFSKYNPHGGSGSSHTAGNGERKSEAEPGKEAAQISGGPLIYTKEQLERQQREIDEETDNSAGGNDEDRKLQEFLSSIREATS